jgi:hypothetical protein
VVTVVTTTTTATACARSLLLLEHILPERVPKLKTTKSRFCASPLAHHPMELAGSSNIAQRVKSQSL